MLVDQPLGLVNFRFGDEGFQSLEMLELQSQRNTVHSKPPEQGASSGGLLFIGLEGVSPGGLTYTFLSTKTTKLAGL